MFPEKFNKEQVAFHERPTVILPGGMRKHGLSRSGVELNTRSSAARALRASLWGRSAFRENDRIEFDSTFYAHCRAYHTDWRGEFTLRSTP